MAHVKDNNIERGKRALDVRHLEGLVAVVFPPSHAYPALALVPLPLFLNALQAVFPLLFWSEVFKIQVNSIKPKFPSSILF